MFRRLSPVFVVVAAFSVIVACGGGDKKTSGTATTASTSSGATTAAGSQSGASAPGEVSAAGKNFSEIKSFRAQITSEAQGLKQDMSIEFVAPDRVHMTISGTPAGALEFIGIGTDAYLKAGPTWIKTSAASTPFDVRSVMTSVNTLSQTQGATKGGTDTVNGKSCQIYTWSAQSSQGSSGEVCIADNQVLRAKTEGGGVKSTIVFKDHNANIEIKPPI